MDEKFNNKILQLIKELANEFIAESLAPTISTKFPSRVNIHGIDYKPVSILENSYDSMPIGKVPAIVSPKFIRNAPGLLNNYSNMRNERTLQSSKGKLFISIDNLDLETLRQELSIGMIAYPIDTIGRKVYETNNNDVGHLSKDENYKVFCINYPQLPNGNVETEDRKQMPVDFEIIFILSFKKYKLLMQQLITISKENSLEFINVLWELVRNILGENNILNSYDFDNPPEVDSEDSQKFVFSDPLGMETFS